MKNTLKLNHENRTIVMDRTFAKRSENTRSEEYAHLQQVRQDYPTYVQMKLTEIDEKDVDRSTELIRSISRSSNSQNKVTDADFFATHPFHIRMEQFSRRIFAPAEAGAQYETKWF